MVQTELLLRTDAPGWVTVERKWRSVKRWTNNITMRCNYETQINTCSNAQKLFLMHGFTLCKMCTETVVEHGLQFKIWAHSTLYWQERSSATSLTLFPASHCPKFYVVTLITITWKIKHQLTIKVSQSLLFRFKGRLCGFGGRAQGWGLGQGMFLGWHNVPHFVPPHLMRTSPCVATLPRATTV